MDVELADDTLHKFILKYQGNSMLLNACRVSNILCTISISAAVNLTSMCLPLIWGKWQHHLWKPKSFNVWSLYHIYLRHVPLIKCPCRGHLVLLGSRLIAATVSWSHLLVDAFQPFLVLIYPRRGLISLHS